MNKDFEIQGTVLIKYLGNETVVKIPDGITGIGDEAFERNFGITEIAIPNTVTFIGNRAFAKCQSITSIVIPDSVARIGKDVFDDCGALTKLTIGSAVAGHGRAPNLKEVVITASSCNTAIPDFAFENCASLVTVTISERVTSLGISSFANCHSLTSISLPDSLLTIGKCAFAWDESIQAIELPQNLQTIDECAFIGDNSLKSFIIPDSVTSIGGGIFGLNKSLESLTLPFVGSSPDLKGSKILAYLFAGNPCSRTDHPIKIPKTLKTIQFSDACTNLSHNVLFDCKSIESVVFSKNIKIIPANACCGCSLHEINIPEGVEEIASGAFGECKLLKAVKLPNSIKIIGGFSNCESLELINIPDGTTIISKDAFCNCKSLKEIVIPHSVESIGRDAFAGCNSLDSLSVPFIGGGKPLDEERSSDIKSFNFILGREIRGLGKLIIDSGDESIDGYPLFTDSNLRTVVLPKTLKSIDLNCFYRCSVLGDLYIPESVEIIKVTNYETRLTSFTVAENNKYYSSENGVLYDKEKHVLIKYPMLKNDESFVVPDSVTKIEDAAFLDCNSLTSLTLNENLVSIGKNAFKNCKGMTAPLVVPNSVTTIGESAFAFLESNLVIKAKKLFGYPKGYDAKFLDDYFGKVSKH